MVSSLPGKGNVFEHRQTTRRRVLSKFLFMPKARTFVVSITCLSRINQAARDISEPLIPHAREVAASNLGEFVDSSNFKERANNDDDIPSDPIRLLWVILGRRSSCL
jgi:hypothetical protein